MEMNNTLLAQNLLAVCRELETLSSLWENPCPTGQSTYYLRSDVHTDQRKLVIPGWSSAILHGP